MKTLLNILIAAAVLNVAPAFAAIKSSSSVPDESAVIFKKCSEIEKLSKKKSATRCLDKFLDRLDVRVSQVESKILTCREQRRVENMEKGERVRDFVWSKMSALRRMQKSMIDSNVAAYEKAGYKVGPRRMKEIELRAGYAHKKEANKLAGLVCDRAAFRRILR